jgi:hypothetical protein
MHIDAASRHWNGRHGGVRLVDAARSGKNGQAEQVSPSLHGYPFSETPKAFV